jgi:hypothetical protein
LEEGGSATLVGFTFKGLVVLKRGHFDFWDLDLKIDEIATVTDEVI